MQVGQSRVLFVVPDVVQFLQLRRAQAIPWGPTHVTDASLSCVARRGDRGARCGGRCGGGNGVCLRADDLCHALEAGVPGAHRWVRPPQSELLDLCGAASGPARILQRQLLGPVLHPALSVPRHASRGVCETLLFPGVPFVGEESRRLLRWGVADEMGQRVSVCDNMDEPRGRAATRDAAAWQSVVTEGGGHRATRVCRARGRGRRWARPGPGVGVNVSSI